MSQKLALERIGPIAVLRLTNPPRNFLGPVVRAEMSQALTALAADATVEGVLLTGSEGLFSTGYNPASPEMRAGTPTLRTLCRQVEEMPKPVVAVLFGAVLGAGLELALAAHARVALRTTRIGMPDIAVGLIPAAGGTQRLPRILGADRALAMMLSGQTLPITHARVQGIADEIVTEGVEKAGAIWLARLIAGEIPVQRSAERTEGLADPMAYQTALNDCRVALGANPPVTERSLVDCVERALLLPFAMAEDFEQVAFEECENSDYAQGLLHVQLAQRRAPNMPEAVSAKPLPVGHLGVVGGGAVGSALVQGALSAGLSVTWFERSPEALDTARARLDSLFESVAMPADTRKACLERLTLSVNLRDLSHADVLIEAVADNMRTKEQVFAALDKVMPTSAILLSHTGTLPIAPIAKISGRVGQVLGLHMVPGPAATRLAELIPGAQSSAVAVVTAAAVLNKMGVLSVRCASGGGSIGGRMIAALRDAADFAVSQGATPAQVDTALAGFGMGVGVFAAMDSIGLDTVRRRAAQLHLRESHALHHLARIEGLLTEGRSGRTAGAGFFDWVEGKPVPRPEDGTGGALSEPLILRLCLGAMMNEGARLLREGIALRPSDIDLVMIRHHGFPVWRGGPMQAADRMRLFALNTAMKPYADTAPRLFAPDPGVAALIKNGEHLEVLNAVGRGRRRIDG